VIERFSKLRKPLSRVGIVLGFGLLLYQIMLGWQAFEFKFVEEFNLWFILLSVGCVSIGILQQVFAWLFILRALGVNLPIWDGVAGYLLSFVGRYIPGSIWGYLGRGEWLWQQYQISFSLSNTASLLEVSLIVLTCLWVVGLSASIKTSTLALMCFVIATISICLLAWLFFRKTVGTSLGKKFLPTLSQGNCLHQPGIWLTIAGLLVINWLYYGLAVYFAGQSLGLWNGVFHLDRWISLINQYALSWLGAFVALFLPSGLGLREFLLTRFLTVEGGLLMAQASALSVITRFLFTLAELFTVIIALLWKAISGTTKRKG
jgi:hypothetical protein